jgi:hypothetical protein
LQRSRTGRIDVQNDKQFYVHKWSFFPISASIGQIACAADNCTPPRNAADFLELAENGDFWIGNVSVPFDETAEGH